MLFCSQTHKFLRGKDLYVVLRETLSIERVLLLSVRPSYQRVRSEGQGVPWWRRICQFRTSDQPNIRGLLRRCEGVWLLYMTGTQHIVSSYIGPLKLYAVVSSSMVFWRQPPSARLTNQLKIKRIWELTISLHYFTHFEVCTSTGKSLGRRSDR